jgi:hypothetical protein
MFIDNDNKFDSDSDGDKKVKKVSKFGMMKPRKPKMKKRKYQVTVVPGF